MWLKLLNNAGWDCFKTPILREILRTQNPLLEEHCAFLEVTHFVPISWIPALDLCDLIVAVLHGNTNQNRKEQGDLLKNKREVCSPPHTIHKRKQSQRVINDLDTVDLIPSNANCSRKEAMLKSLKTTKQ